MRILLLEKNAELAASIEQEMHEHQAVSLTCHSVESASRHIADNHIDAAILELDTPHRPALTLIQDIRNLTSPVPIIVITDSNDIDIKLRALEMGADDYVIKPFTPHELVARLLVRIRTYQNQLSKIVKLGNLSLDLIKQQCHFNSHEVHLTNIEWQIMKQLALNANEIVRKGSLEAACKHLENQSNSVEVHIHHLRKKTDKSLIRTIRGVGYSLALAKSS